jgi:hypothetical protein
MKTETILLILFFAMSPTCFSQTDKKPISPLRKGPAEQKQPKTPKVITAEDVKAIWIKKLVPPKTLDPSYHKTIRGFKKYVEDIKAGKLDALAQETAATHNRNRALSEGDAAAAAIYESELNRLATLKAERARNEQADAAAARYTAQLMQINSTLTHVEAVIQAKP